MTILYRSAAYFGLVFGVGFILGPIRVLFLAPRIGERAAELIEAPLMLAAIIISARYTVKRFPAQGPSQHLSSGIISLALLLLMEFAVVLRLRGQSVSEYVESRDPITGAVYIILLLLFAVMPWFIAKRRFRVAV